jgi:hypothetical protein
MFNLKKISDFHNSDNTNLILFRNVHILSKAQLPLVSVLAEVAEMPYAKTTFTVCYSVASA